MLKRFMTLCVVVCLIMSASACDGGGDNFDPNRTQLFVGIMDNGIGQEWLDAIKVEYEKVRTDIEVIIDLSPDHQGNVMRSTMPQGRNDVLFGQQNNYSDFVGLSPGTTRIVADITDIVTDLDENGKSIHSKLMGGMKQYYNIGSDDSPSYFGLPYFITTRSAIYDEDLFKDKNLYNLSGYKGLDGVDGTHPVTGINDDNYGPDGKEGTYDDGLPATWEDMKELLDDMVSKKVIPFTWTGQQDSYRNNWLHNIWASYEGAHDYSLGYTLNGTHQNSNLGTVNNTNGYKVMEQEGRYAALTVAKHLATNPDYFSSSAFKSSQSHIQAQLEYIGSTRTQNPIAFLLEGGWWENECKSGFDEMAAKYGEKYAYGNRNFRYFPFPKFIGTSGINDQLNDETVMFFEAGVSMASCFIKDGSRNMDIAKDFVKFTYSDEMLALFTKITGIVKPFEYDMSKEDLDSMTSFTRDIWTLLSDNSVQKVFASTRNEVRNLATSYFSNWGFSAKHDSKIFAEPLKSFYVNSDLTVDQYFNGGISGYYNKASWDEMYSQYFG